MRAMFKRVPSSPRCKQCNSPFRGIGGRIVGVMGFRPSRKNPNFCNACFEKLPPGGIELDIAVLFADVRGSTELGEKLGPSAYADMMNRFYSVATAVLLKYDALIDKLIGDEVMALFIPGVSGPEYRRRAAEAGEALLRALRDGETGEQWLPVGVAVHAGLAYVGNVGSGGIGDFTALGDTVNTTARLQAAASAGELVLTEALYDLVAERFPAPESRTLTLRGKEQPVAVKVIKVA